MTLNQITELHLHTHHSPLDGLNTQEEYCERAKQLGMSHLAITDHGTLSGHRGMQTAAKQAGLVPILGLEAYISPTDRFDKRAIAKRDDNTSAYNHIILLAQNETGLSNLNRLSQIGWTEGFYHKPRIDFEVLSEYKDGLIVLSGCLGGLISKAIEAGNMDMATALARKFKSEFKGSFYIEVQADNPPEINHGLLEIADRLGISPVITGDCHYADPKDRWVEEAFLILSTNPQRLKGYDLSKSQRMDMLERFNYLYPDRRMTFQNWDLFLAGRETRFAKMAAMGIERQDIYENTNEIASRIGDYPYYEGLDLLPPPKAKDPDERLRTLFREGMRRLGLSGIPEYEDRGELELNTIIGKGFSSYFVIKANMVNWARKQGIRVGPARGSAAGSLVCYAMHITDVDPIKHGLLFFRFIDPGRPDWPDIDTDYMDSRRGEVKAYAKKMFKHVASITTVNTYQEKKALKDAARVFGIPPAEANRAVKNLDTDRAFEQYQVSKVSREFHLKYPEVLDLAKRLKGRISGYGMHAGGLVVSKEPISKYVPMETRKDPDDDVSGRLEVVAFDKKQIAGIGLIKYDELGLKTLSVIDDTIKAIQERHGIDVEKVSMALDDPAVYKPLGEGYTKGVFQAEGPAFTKWLIETGCSKFDDLVIGTSIARPGPMDTVGVVYKNRLSGKEPVRYVHEIMEEYTKETLGCIVYQEQVMQAMTELAGMPATEANRVRKILADKDDPAKLEAYREQFVTGASKHIPVAEAEKLWHDFEAHTGYSFNKSHAVAYSMLTYQTAWLKYYYPIEFMCATLNHEKDKDAVTDYLIESKRLGVTIKLPHVNHSDIDFSIKDDSVRFGLKRIKFISDKTAKPLIAARPFHSYAQLEETVLTKGSGMNRRMLSALNKVGAATFDDNPKTGRERDNFYEYLQIPAFQDADIPPRIKAQFVPLEDYSDVGAFPILATVRKIRRGEGWALLDILDETGTAGVFTDPNTAIEPGQRYAMLVSNNRVARFVTFQDLLDKTKHPFTEYLYRTRYNDVSPGQYKVLSFQKRDTKAGKKMAYLVLSSHDKELISALVFPGMYMQAYSKCIDNGVVAVEFKQTQDGTVFVDKFVM
jgi:DNA polymerase-3 subunit alpha